MYSPDGLWWWNGADWVPAPHWRTRYEATPWTRELQSTVLALQVLAVLVSLTTVPGIADSVLSSSPALAGDPQAAESLHQLMGGVIVVVMVLVVGLLAVIVVGV